jgi:hypothetical protein
MIRCTIALGLVWMISVRAHAIEWWQAPGLEADMYRRHRRLGRSRCARAVVVIRFMDSGRSRLSLVGCFSGTKGTSRSDIVWQRIIDRCFA